MKTTIRIFAAFLTFIILLGSIPAHEASAVQSAYTMTYTANQLVVYYQYDASGSVYAVADRQVKFKGSTVEISGQVLETARMNGCAPVWYGDYLCWTNSSGIFTYWNFNTKGTPVTGVSNVIGFDYDPNGVVNNGQLIGVKLADGRTISFAEACVYTPTVAPTQVPTQTPTAVPTNVPEQPTVAPEPSPEPTVTQTPSPVPTAVPTQVPTQAPTVVPTQAPTQPAPSPKVDIDIVGTTTVYSFSGHTLKVEGSKFVLDGYNISERCNSGVKFGAIVSDTQLLLYEDSSKIVYLFDVKNPFNPTVLMSGSAPTIKISESTGYLETINGLPLSKWMALNTTVKIPAYAINKVNYSNFYSGETSHILEVTGNTLMFDGKKVRTVNKVPETGGLSFTTNYIFVVDGTKRYRAHQSTPTKWTLMNQNVEKERYSSTNGLDAGFKRLAQRMDYVKNPTRQALLYQNGKKSTTVSIAKNKLSVKVNGQTIKKIKKLTKKQLKKGKKQLKFYYVRITEQNELIVVYSNGTKYKAPLSNPYALKRFKKNISVNSLGFAELI